MQTSYDLAFITANIHLSHRPRFLSSSHLTFGVPVPIGSILDFTSRIVMQDINRFCVTVTAEMISPADASRTTAGVFHYTFSRVLSNDVDPQATSPATDRPKEFGGKELIAETYGDAIRAVAARRREFGGLSRADQIKVFRELRLPADE